MRKSTLMLVIILVLGCHKATEDLPVLSYKINTNGEEEYYTVTYSNFTNQFEKDFTTNSIKDKIVVSNFFFTRCPSICPPMRNQLIKLANYLSFTEDVILVSHTIDPDNDTSEVLKAYAQSTGIEDHKWQFIRSSESNTKLQAAQYMTNFRPNEDSTDFYHSSFVALLDKKQQIRGFYNILIQEEVERLKEDIKLLLE